MSTADPVQTARQEPRPPDPKIQPGRRTSGMTRLGKRLLLRRYGRAICVSRYVQDCLAEQAVWSNLVSQLHFINTDRFRPDEAERRRIRVGKGPEEVALRKLCAELGLGDRVQFLGQQKHVQPYLQAADCFVCPSLWGEAAGLVNIEAQACGTPVIASRIGGIPEYVAEGHTGLLFTPIHPSRCRRRTSRIIVTILCS